MSKIITNHSDESIFYRSGPHLDQAQRLAQVWIERERNLRKKVDDERGKGDPAWVRHAAMADSVKQCRLDIQWEFSLTQRLGPGPMTDAEKLEQEVEKP